MANPLSFLNACAFEYGNDAWLIRAAIIFSYGRQLRRAAKPPSLRPPMNGLSCSWVMPERAVAIPIIFIRVLQSEFSMSFCRARHPSLRVTSWGTIATRSHGASAFSATPIASWRMRFRKSVTGGPFRNQPVYQNTGTWFSPNIEVIWPMLAKHEVDCSRQ